MIINAYYYVSVLSSFTSVIGDSGIAFGDSKTRSLLKNLAKAYSRQCNDLVVFGQVDDTPEIAFFQGKALSITYDDELNETYFYADGDVVLILRETNAGFALEKQALPGGKA